MLRPGMRSAIVALLFAACTTAMSFRVIDQGAYGDPITRPAAILQQDGRVLLRLGQRMTGGWSIEPLAVSMDGDVLTVKTRIHAPAGGSIVTESITYPYVVISVDAHPKRVRWVDENGDVIVEAK